jgi:hypothetical protein
MKISKAQEKRNRDRVSALYTQACNGVQISILDVGRVMKVGLDGVAAGLDDEAIKKSLSDFVATIRKN